jgi:mRNA-degrading endonuclease RelE of RelBE toxin-antitoxin system
MFKITLTEDARVDLVYIKKNDRNAILDAAALQLSVEPLKQTRHRKQLDPNDLTRWELRVGDFRVFYDVDEPGREVSIKAVGWKEHNKLFFRGKEREL